MYPLSGVRYNTKTVILTADGIIYSAWSQKGGLSLKIQLSEGYT